MGPRIVPRPVHPRKPDDGRSLSAEGVLSCCPHRVQAATPGAGAAVAGQPTGPPMLSANAFTIRPARKSDDPTLAWLAALSSRPAVARPALIGDIDGIPAAALSLVDGRVVADPFRPTSVLCADLRLHRSG